MSTAAAQHVVETEVAHGHRQHWADHVAGKEVPSTAQPSSNPHQELQVETELHRLDHPVALLPRRQAHTGNGTHQPEVTPKIKMAATRLKTRKHCPT